MSRDLIKFSTEHKISKEEWHRSWTPKKYFRFNNDELEELFTKDPHIEFEYGEAALLFFEQGIRPSSTQPASQGFPYFVSFFKSSTGRIKGIVEFIPANNKDDGLSGKTADDKDFEYKGKKYGVKTDQPLSGSTGLIHRLGLQQLAMLNPELYSDDKGEFDRSIPQMAGGIFLGETNVLQEFRTNSGNVNENNFPLNKLFLLCHCDNTETEAANSDWWYARIIPTALSDPFLEFLLKTLPLKSGQERNVTVDRRHTVGGTAYKLLSDVKRWDSLSKEELRHDVEQRLLYFSSKAFESKTYPKRHHSYNVENILYVSRDQGVYINVDVKDENNRTPLSHCIERGLIDDIRVLLESGANLFLPDKTGKMPVDYDNNFVVPNLIQSIARFAGNNGNHQLREQMRTHAADYVYRKLQTEGYQYIDGAYVKSLSKEEVYRQPFQKEAIKAQLERGELFHAIIQQSPHLMYDTLLHCKIDLTIRDHKGLTAFDYFLTKEQSHRDDGYCLRLFLADRASFTVPWPDRLQPLLLDILMQDARNNRYEYFLHVKNSFDVNIACPHVGFRLMDYAVLAGNAEMVRSLLEVKANPNLKNRAENNSLHMLFINKDIKPEQVPIIARLLLDAGCDPFSVNRDGKTAYDLCPGFLKPLLDKHIEKNRVQRTSQNRYSFCQSLTTVAPALPPSPSKQASPT